MECTFSLRCGGPCGPLEGGPVGIHKLPIASCNKDISNHMRFLKIGKTVHVACEQDLIFARAGIYAVPPDISNYNICKCHRDSLGLGWRRTSKYCQVPMSVAAHKSKRTGDRGIGLSHSKKVFELSGQIMPLGAGKQC